MRLCFCVAVWKHSLMRLCCCLKTLIDATVSVLQHAYGWPHLRFNRNANGLRGDRHEHHRRQCVHPEPPELPQLHAVLRPVLHATKHPVVELGGVGVEGGGKRNSGMLYKVIVDQVREWVGRFIWNVVSCPVCAHWLGLAQVSPIVALSLSSTCVVRFAARSYAASVCQFFFLHLYRVQDVWKLWQCQLKL